MTMKWSILIAYLVLLTAVFGVVTGYAQGPRQGGDPEQMLDRMMSGLKDRLSLTADQEQQVRALLKDNFEKAAELRSEQQNDTAGPRRPSPEMRDHLMKMREELNTELSKVLTEDQMKKYQELQQERRGRFGRGRRVQ